MTQTIYDPVYTYIESKGEEYSTLISLPWFGCGPEGWSWQSLLFGKTFGNIKYNTNTLALGLLHQTTVELLKSTEHLHSVQKNHPMVLGIVYQL